MKRVMIFMSIMFVSTGVFGMDYSNSSFSQTEAYNLTGLKSLSRAQQKEFDKLISDIQENRDVSVRNQSIINVYSEYGMTPLTKALLQGRDKVVKELVKKGAIVDYKVQDVDYPLLCAQNIEIAEYLVENGAKVDYKDEEGNSLLHLAAQNNKLFLVKWLVEERGLRVNDINSAGETALSIAEDEGCDEIVDYLLEHGAKE